MNNFCKSHKNQWLVVWKESCTICNHPDYPIKYLIPCLLHTACHTGARLHHRWEEVNRETRKLKAGKLCNRGFLIIAASAQLVEIAFDRVLKRLFLQQLKAMDML